MSVSSTTAIASSYVVDPAPRRSPPKKRRALWLPVRCSSGISIETNNNSKSIEDEKGITSDGMPSQRSGHCACMSPDPASPFKNIMYVVGGWCGYRLMDIWELNIETGTWKRIWSPINTSNYYPKRRVGHTCCLVDGDRKILLFGGRDDYYVKLNDLWEFDLETLTWTQIYANTLESSRSSSSSNNNNDAIAIQIDLSSSSPQKRVYNDDDDDDAPIIFMPEARITHTACMFGQYMYIFGGLNSNDTSCLNDLWQYDTKTRLWKQIHYTGETIPPRERHTAVVDVTKRRMIIFGGYDVSSNAFRDDIFAINLDTFHCTKIAFLGRSDRTTGGGGGGLRSHTAVVTADKRKMVVFSGRNAISGDNNDLFEFDLDTHKWTKLESNSNVPLARGRHSAVTAAHNGAMIIFGGNAGNTSRWLNDVSACHFGTYSRDIANMFDDA